MKVGAVTLGFNDEDIIAGTLKCLKPFVDKHIVLVSEKPYFGKYIKPDRTADIAEEHGCQVIRGEWELDHFQRNLGNKMCSGCDWVLGFDSDERMTAEDLEKLLGYLNTCKENAVAMLPEIYWKTTDYVLRPRPAYTPVIAMRPHVRFTHIRNIDHSYEMWNDGILHHLSWCSPKDILKKVRHYAHATDFDGDKWYKENYKYWLETDGKAILPDGEYEVLKQPLPGELKGGEV